MKGLTSTLLGGIELDESEEYLQFRFRSLFVLLIFGVFSSALFLLADHYHVSQFTPHYILAVKIQLGVALCSIVFLYGRKRFYHPLAWLYVTTSYLASLSTLILVPQDELRVIWLVLALPGIYLLLGTFTGALATFLSMACFFEANRRFSTHYSTHTLTSALAGFVYLSVFLYVYSRKFSSCFFQKQQLRQKTTYDLLTSIMNHEAFFEVGTKIINLFKRDARPISVLLVHLDQFNTINDKLGRDTGDKILKRLVTCLKENVRESDTIGRIGGDSFSLFLPDTDLSGAKIVAEKVRSGVEGLSFFDGAERITITASIGVAVCIGRNFTMADIMDRAEHAMSNAKLLRGNCFFCSDGFGAGPKI
jgi:diguanylate cyclase (GGDEF)-like protein